MALKLFTNRMFGMKTSIFCHIFTQRYNNNNKKRCQTWTPLTKLS